MSTLAIKQTKVASIGDNITKVVTVGMQGATGANGIGVPVGGATGQVLAKAGNTDYDTEWLSVGGTGTVTSVALNVPTGLVASGSPITTAGTLSISLDTGYVIPLQSTLNSFLTSSALTPYALLSGATFTGTISATNLSGTNTGDQTNITGNAGTVTTINGRIEAGTNVTITGSGTAASPYNISSAGGGSWGSITGTLSDQTDLQAALDAKQATLVSGTNIKTINSTAILGSGDISVATAAQGALADTALQSYTVTEGDVTAHEAALTITSSQISDYSTSLSGKTNTTAFTPTSDYHPATKKYVDDEITGAGGYNDEAAQDAVGGILTDSSEIDFTYDDATPSITASIKAGSIDETKLDSSTNASLDLADSATQPADIANFITASSTDTLTNKSGSNSQWTNDEGYITDYTVTEGDVTAHQAALTITESQISDFGTYQPLAAVLTNTTASFTTADETKLDGIEAGATADQSDSEIKTAYENNADTNAFTDAEQTKLSGIETSADVTDETNVKAALDNATLTDVGTPASTDRILLQDASDSNNLKYADFSEFGGGASQLSDLSDVGTTTPTLGNVLVGDGTDFDSGALAAEYVTVDTTGFKVLGGAGNMQAVAAAGDTAAFHARGTEVRGGTGAVSFTIGATTFDVAATKGQIRDGSAYYNIDYAGATGVSVISTSSPSIYVYIDAAGALQQQTTEPTREEFREKLFLTRLAFSGSTLAAQEQIANPSGQYTNTFRDYLSYVSSPKKGLALSGNASLTFQVAAGSIFELGTNNAGSYTNPNELSFSAQDPTTFFYLKQDATIATAQTSINVTQYDDGGTLTNMTNNRFKIMVVYKFNSGNHVVQESQDQYSSLDEAQAAISTRTFVENAALANGTRLGWILVKKNATDLTDTSEARFVQDNGSFSTSVGVTGALLASNDLSDLANTTTARANLGVEIGVDVQGHSAVLDATTASFTTADETKLDGIETAADVTDETNVIAALSGATLTAVTVAGTDKVLIQDASDSDNTKTVTAQSIADLGGGDVATDDIWDAKGDLAGGTGSNTASRLAVGSDGQVLVADSSEATGMKWESAAGLGKVLEVQDASSSSSIDFELVGSYRRYIIEIEDYVPSTAQEVLLRYDTGSGFISTSTYQQSEDGRDSDGNPIEGNASNNDGISLSGNDLIDSTSSNSNNFKIEVVNPSASNRTWSNIEGNYKVNGTSRWRRVTGAGNNDSTSAVTDVQIIPSTGTITSGKFTLIGINDGVSTGGIKLDEANEYTKTQNFDATTLTDAATINWNLEDNQVTSVTLGGNRTMAAPTNLKDGATYILRVIQDATGSRTITWNSVFKWPSGTAPTLSTGANDIDLITFVSDGTNLYGTAQLDFS
ncbi:hypothetical protein [uncultured Paraglaciecola sp.]|uniref:beta strand repeat-containing protein n=1 Tax=uncultured Paraglaciecola sp. TaxID=1765024 RepID=UPI0026056642|nr:hypothetical protein [uncultured Paraglaciecola sp.]